MSSIAEWSFLSLEFDQLLDAVMVPGDLDSPDGVIFQIKINNGAYIVITPNEDGLGIPVPGRSTIHLKAVLVSDTAWVGAPTLIYLSAPAQAGLGVIVHWSPSLDSDIASYRLERATAVSGPWTPVATITHEVSGPNYDTQTSTFFYEDPAGNGSTWYQVVPIDSAEQAGEPSTPFRSSTEGTALLPALVGVLNVTVGNVGSLLNLGFTHIEIWESHNDGGTWEEITGGTYSPATASSVPASNTFRVGGQTLRFKMDEFAESVVEFSDVITDWTPAQVAERINQVAPGVASASGMSVLLTSANAGRQAALEILETPSDLAFNIGITRGRDARLVLRDSIVSYPYYDVASVEGSRYKWRFSANGAQPVSVFSKYVLPRQMARDGIKRAIGKATFVSLDGRPKKTRLLIATLNSPTLLSNGMFTAPDTVQQFESDDLGYIEAELVVGAKVRIAIEGTGYVREVTIPDAVTFDLLQVMSEGDDAFTIQTVAPLLTRRSL